MTNDFLFKRGGWVQVAGAVLILLAVLTACAPSAEQLAAAQHAKCVELGYTAGTTEYGDCRLALMMVAEQRRASAISAWSAVSQPGTAFNPMAIR